LSGVIVDGGTGSGQLHPEGHGRQNPANQERERRRSELDAAGFIGTSWSLIEIKREGRFLRGRLVDPRGGIQRGRVFVIASELDCG
jgi:hypothetical protein